MNSTVQTVTTVGGVTAVDEKPGWVEFIRNAPGDTVVDLRVTDGEGSQITIHLGYDELVELAAKAGWMAITI